MELKFLRKLKKYSSGYAFYFDERSSLLHKVIYSITTIKKENEESKCLAYVGYEIMVVEKTKDIEKYIKDNFKKYSIILIQDLKINPLFKKQEFIENLHEAIKKLVNHIDQPAS
jgi:hypothetical protein